jgi:hypothetical protein
MKEIRKSDINILIYEDSVFENMYEHFIDVFSIFSNNRKYRTTVSILIARQMQLVLIR